MSLCDRTSERVINDLVKDEREERAKRLADAAIEVEKELAKCIDDPSPPRVTIHRMAKGHIAEMTCTVSFQPMGHVVGDFIAAPPFAVKSPELAQGVSFTERIQQAVQKDLRENEARCIALATEIKALAPTMALYWLSSPTHREGLPFALRWVWNDDFADIQASTFREMKDALEAVLAMVRAKQ